MPKEEEAFIEIELSLNNEKTLLSIPANTSVAQLKESISLDKITLISKGKKLNDADLVLQSKILVIQTPLNKIATANELLEYWNQNKRNYEKHVVHIRSTSKRVGFVRNITVLSEFSDTLKATQLLEQLRDDFSIIQIMERRDWRVNTFRELHPHRDSKILGYNQNKGWEIALRLRTDALDGFRSYSSIVKVLLHELAHMVFSEHDANFHALDRALNLEYVPGRGPQEKIHGPSGLILSTQKLGGLDSGDLPMRDKLYQAAQLRLTKEEQEMEQKCIADVFK
jgi:dimeric dUTPase (all-alpha-NTP-PPase superfamily)